MALFPFRRSLCSYDSCKQNVMPQEKKELAHVMSTANAWLKLSHGAITVLVQWLAARTNSCSGTHSYELAPMWEVRISMCENVLDGPCYRLGHNKISGDLDLAMMNNPTCKSKQFQPEVPNQEIPKNHFKTVWKRRVTSLISPTTLLPTRKRTTVLVRSTDHNHVQPRNYTVWLLAPWSLLRPHITCRSVARKWLTNWRLLTFLELGSNL